MWMSTLTSSASPKVPHYLLNHRWMRIHLWRIVWITKTHSLTMTCSCRQEHPVSEAQSQTTKRRVYRCMSECVHHLHTKLMKSNRLLILIPIKLASILNNPYGAVYRWLHQVGSLFRTIKKEHKEIFNTAKYSVNSLLKQRYSNWAHFHWYFMSWMVITDAISFTDRLVRVRPTRWACWIRSAMTVRALSLHL